MALPASDTTAPLRDGRPPASLLTGEQLAGYRAQWRTVEKAQAKVGLNTTAAFGGGGFLTFDFLDFAHSLVLLFAYSVLEHLLKDLRDAGAFTASGRSMNLLMAGSQAGLTWQSFATVVEGREARNAVAHELRYPGRVESWRYIAAVEAELIAWGILEEPGATGDRSPGRVRQHVPSAGAP